MSDPFAIPGTAPHPAGHHPFSGQGRSSSLKGLAVALTVLIGLACLMLMFSVIGLLMRAAWADRISDGTVFDEDEAMTLDGVVVLASLGYVVVLIAAAVVFMIWQYRHAKNARILGQVDGLGPGWAIGGWFIPFANLVLPAVQLFGSSKVSTVGPDGRRGDRGAGIVIAWAIAFGLGEVVTRAAAFGEPPVGSPSYLDWLATSDRAQAAGSLILMVAGLLAVVMVWSLTKRQQGMLATIVPRLWGAVPPQAYPGSGHPAQYSWPASPAAWHPAPTTYERPTTYEQPPPPR